MFICRSNDCFLVSRFRDHPGTKHGLEVCVSNNEKEEEKGQNSITLSLTEEYDLLSGMANMSFRFGPKSIIILFQNLFDKDHSIFSIRKTDKWQGYIFSLYTKLQCHRRDIYHSSIAIKAS